VKPVAGRVDDREDIVETDALHLRILPLDAVILPARVDTVKSRRPSAPPRGQRTDFKTMKWWRRRESNPCPETFGHSVYRLVRCFLSHLALTPPTGP